MSSRHLAWAMSLTTVKGTSRHVLLQLAHLADRNNGFVTRSHQQLAHETGYSVRTIQDALKELAKPGTALIERKRRTSKRGRLADTFKVLAVLPAKSAGRSEARLPAKSAERPGKNCRAYTGEESNNHHLVANAPAADDRPDTHDERALRLAGLPGSPCLGECQRCLSALDEAFGRPLVDRALRELMLQSGVAKPAGLLRAICRRLSDEGQPVKSPWSTTSHGLSRF